MQFIMCKNMLGQCHVLHCTKSGLYIHTHIFYIYSKCLQLYNGEYGAIWHWKGGSRAESPYIRANGLQFPTIIIFRAPFNMTSF